MLGLNATVIVQVINFGVVWWFLDRFFFRSIVHIIQREQAQTQTLVQSIEKERMELQAERERQRELWRHYRQIFKEKSPYIVQPHISSLAPVLCPVPFALEKNKKELLIKEIKQEIVNKVMAHG